MSTPVHDLFVQAARLRQRLDRMRAELPKPDPISDALDALDALSVDDLRAAKLDALALLEHKCRRIAAGCSIQHTQREHEENAS